MSSKRSLPWIPTRRVQELAGEGGGNHLHHARPPLPDVPPALQRQFRVLRKHMYVCLCACFVSSAGLRVSSRIRLRCVLGRIRTCASQDVILSHVCI